MRDKGIRSVSVEPGEILFAPRRIVVETTAAIDGDSARDGVSVVGCEGAVRVSREGRRLTWTPRSALPLGQHVLRIGKLVSSSNRLVAPGAQIEFSVAETAGTVPPRAVVESALRLGLARGKVTRLPLYARARGKYVELLKARDRRTGKPIALAFDQQGRKVDGERLVYEIVARRFARVGKLHPGLHARLKGLRATARVPIAVWLHREETITFEQATRQRARRADSAPAEVARERKAMTAALGELAAGLQALGARNLRVATAVPAIAASMTPAQIRRAARRPDIAGVYFRDPRGFDDLVDSIDIADSGTVHAAGVKGAGIRVAVWERGPDVTTNLQIQGRFDTSSSASTSAHARLTHAIVRNKQQKAPNGHAPSCLLYSANSYDLDALDWALDTPQCTVISQSFHRDDEQTDDGLSFDDIYKDWRVLHWPFPTIVQASGNDASPNVEFVNHKGYNSLAVGSHDDAAAAMAATSVYRNPSAPHGDRELPEICANGTSVTAVGRTSSGTSFAAPGVAGIAALIQSTDTTLKRWPEGCRAILLAGASRNVNGRRWWIDVVAGNDAADGAGAANAFESYRITQRRSRRNGAASWRGWDVGTLRSRDFDKQKLSTFRYRVKVPRLPKQLFLYGPQKVRVVLAWNSRVYTWRDFLPWLPDSPLLSILGLDLDLKIYDSNGTQVGYSGSWDNSYEIAEFTGQPGEEYEIRIRRWSGTENTWYGIAWTVTGGLSIQAVLSSDQLVRLERAMRALLRGR